VLILDRSAGSLRPNGEPSAFDSGVGCAHRHDPQGRQRWRLFDKVGVEFPAVQLVRNGTTSMPARAPAPRRQFVVVPDRALEAGTSRGGYLRPQISSYR
jgi:hypothetical protein